MDTDGRGLGLVPIISADKAAEGKIERASTTVKTWVIFRINVPSCAVAHDNGTHAQHGDGIQRAGIVMVKFSLGMQLAVAIQYKGNSVGSNQNSKRGCLEQWSYTFE